MSSLLMDTHEGCQNYAANDKAFSNDTFKAENDVEHFGNGVTSDDANEAEDVIANILSLKLKRPKQWKWELSTSRSCSNISLPRILLYDHKGRLLVDANTQEEKVYKQPIEIPQRKSINRKRTSKAATTSLVHSLREVLDEECDGLEIQEATPSLKSPNNSTHDTRNSSPAATSSSCIDFFTNDLSDYKFERRSSSLKSVRFRNEIPQSTENSFQLGDLPTPPPSSNTTPTNSSSGPREKRRYRRSHSSGHSPINSPSILERFSFNRGRFSSPEYAEDTEVYRPPRYFLRTSKAGTLIVQEESFSRYRRRPRCKHSSCENFDNVNSPKSQSSSSLKKIGSFSSQFGKDLNVAASLDDISEKRDHRRKKVLASRRRRSDANILMKKTLATTSEEENNGYTSQENECDTEERIRRPHWKSENFKRHLKSDLVSIHPENGILHPYGSPTER